MHINNTRESILKAEISVLINQPELFIHYSEIPSLNHFQQYCSVLKSQYENNTSVILKKWFEIFETELLSDEIIFDQFFGFKLNSFGSRKRCIQIYKNTGYSNTGVFDILLHFIERQKSIPLLSNAKLTDLIVIGLEINTYQSIQESLNKYSQIHDFKSCYPKYFIIKSNYIRKNLPQELHFFDNRNNIYHKYNITAVVFERNDKFSTIINNGNIRIIEEFDTRTFQNSKLHEIFNQYQSTQDKKLHICRIILQYNTAAYIINETKCTAVNDPTIINNKCLTTSNNELKELKKNTPPKIFKQKKSWIKKFKLKETRNRIINDVNCNIIKMNCVNSKYNISQYNITSEDTKLLKLFSMHVQNIQYNIINDETKTIQQTKNEEVIFFDFQRKTFFLYENNLFSFNRINEVKPGAQEFLIGDFICKRNYKCWAMNHASTKCEGEYTIKFYCGHIPHIECKNKCNNHKPNNKLFYFLKEYLYEKISNKIDEDIHNIEGFGHSRKFYYWAIQNLKSSLGNITNYPIPQFKDLRRNICFKLGNNVINDVDVLENYVLQQMKYLECRRKLNSNSILFCTENSLKRLTESTTFFGDGTFDLPRFCKNSVLHRQVYRIDSSLHNQDYSRSICLPSVLALLETKNEEDYKWLFTEIQNLLNKYNLKIDPTKTVAMFDYEWSARKCCKQILGVNILGCMFHFNQNIVAHLKELHLWSLYLKGQVNSDGLYEKNYDYCKEFRQLITQIMALCVVPIPMIEHLSIILFQKLETWSKRYSKIYKKIRLKKAIKQFITYMYDTWIDLEHNRDHQARFSPCQWNVSQTLAKTTNPTEQLNRWLKMSCGNYYTGVELLQWFQEELEKGDIIHKQVTQYGQERFLNIRSRRLLYKYSILNRQFHKLNEIYINHIQNKETTWSTHNSKLVIKITDIMQEIGNIIDVFRKFKWSKNSVCYIFYICI